VSVAVGLDGGVAAVGVVVSVVGAGTGVPQPLTRNVAITNARPADSLARRTAPEVTRRMLPTKDDRFR